MDERQKFIRDYNEAFARRDTDYLVLNVTENIRWNIIGYKKVEGRKAFMEALKQMHNSEPQELEIYSVIVQGQEAVVSGIRRMPFKLGISQSYVFCDGYKLEGIKVKEITSYVLQVPV